MARVSLRKEIAGILEKAMPCGVIEDYYVFGETQYRAQSGNFTCTFATDKLTSREEVVSALEKKAETMFRKPRNKVNRAAMLQEKLLFISEHREIIPLLQFLRQRCNSKDKVASTMKKWVDLYSQKYGAIPPYVKPYYYPGFTKLYYNFVEHRSPESLYEVADMIPAAWCRN